MNSETKLDVLSKWNKVTAYVIIPVIISIMSVTIYSGIVLFEPKLEVAILMVMIVFGMCDIYMPVKEKHVMLKVFYEDGHLNMYKKLATNKRILISYIHALLFPVLVALLTH
ncbi:hypothetical protein [Rossellomorea marisflavi]|uniref:hypothetical protein n=1 Tax=Rossellomorea marisflavi TaxID=189381 RepID=UPI0034585FB2